MYSNDQRDVLVAAADAMLSTAAAKFWAPGYQAFRVQAAAIVVTTAVSVAPAVVTINHRPTAGSATGEVVVDVITVPTNTAAGKVIYVDGLDVIVEPGGEIEFDGDGGGTAGAGHIILFGHTVPRSPNSNMTLSA